MTDPDDAEKAERYSLSLTPSQHLALLALRAPGESFAGLVRRLGEEYRARYAGEAVPFALSPEAARTAHGALAGLAAYLPDLMDLAATVGPLTTEGAREATEAWQGPLIEVARSLARAVNAHERIRALPPTDDPLDALDHAVWAFRGILGTVQNDQGPDRLSAHPQGRLLLALLRGAADSAPAVSPSSAPAWTPVAERTPPPWQRVLVLPAGAQEPYIARWDDVEETWRDDAAGAMARTDPAAPVRWMPLPGAPPLEVPEAVVGEMEDLLEQGGLLVRLTPVQAHSALQTLADADDDSGTTTAIADALLRHRHIIRAGGPRYVSSDRLCAGLTAFRHLLTQEKEAHADDPGFLLDSPQGPLLEALEAGRQTVEEVEWLREQLTKAQKDPPDEEIKKRLRANGLAAIKRLVAKGGAAKGGTSDTVQKFG